MLIITVKYERDPVPKGPTEDSRPGAVEIILNQNQVIGTAHLQSGESVEHRLAIRIGEVFRLAVGSSEVTRK